MTTKKSGPPLFYDSDTTELRANIVRLIKLGHFVRRCSPHHLRVERVNFWPTTGRIQVDGEISHQKRGWHELFGVLAEISRSKWHRPSAPTEIVIHCLADQPLDLVAPTGDLTELWPVSADEPD